MDDREIAEIIRKRNLAYVRHLKETNPHSEKHDTLQGGFFNLIAAAAKIAAKMALKASQAAAKAAARTAAKAGRLAAKAARKGTKAAQRAATKAAKAANKAAQKASKAKNLDKLDKAMTTADLAQAGYNIAQIVMQKKLDGEEISEEEWEELSNTQKVQVDFQRWARGLEKEDYNLFKQRGGNKAAAIQVVRLMEAGIDPNDWVGSSIENRIEGIADAIEDIDDTDPADEEDCQALLDIDDRTQEELIGLEIAEATVDPAGIGTMISEKELEKRQRRKFDYCVEQKKRELQALRNGLMSQLGLDPDDEVDPENRNIINHVSNTLSAENPILRMALTLDGLRAMNGLPPIDQSGNVLKDPDSIANDNCEKIAIYFIQNQTTDYSDQPWIIELLKDDPTIVNRAIARMPFFDSFCSSIPEMNAFRNEYTSETIPLTPEEIAENNIIDSTTELWNRDTSYQQGALVRKGTKVYRCLGGKKTYTTTDQVIVEQVQGKDPTGSDGATYWEPLTRNVERPNVDGIRLAENLRDWLNDIQDEVDEATEATRIADEIEKAQQVTEIYNPNKDYKIGDKVIYEAKVYECHTAQAAGEAKPDPNKWEELSLYNDKDFEDLENIGLATPWEAHKIYPIGAFVTVAPDRIYRKIKESGAGILTTDTEYWDEVLLNNADLLDLRTNPGRKWNSTTDYKTGDKVFWNVDLQSYTAVKDSKNRRPDDPEHWRKIYSYILSKELVKNIKIQQRAAIFSSAVNVAVDFDPDDIYELHDIVCGYDGNYYELIKEKKNRNGDVIQPPIPPNKTYWKLISDGITVFDPDRQYILNDFVQYENKHYINTKDGTTPKGTLPTDVNYWEPLEPIFEDLDPELIALNIERFNEAIINRADQYYDDITASYDVGDVVKVFDNDGYPQFYECIKDVLFGSTAPSEDLRKAVPYNNGEMYGEDSIVSSDGMIYKKIKYSARGFGPPNPEFWTAIGYEKDPGPPNPEFWKDYSAVDIEDEKNEKARKGAVVGSPDASGLFVGQLVKDPSSGYYYRLIIDPDKLDEHPFNIPDFGTMKYFMQGRNIQKEPNESDIDAINKYNTSNPQMPIGYKMEDLPDFDNEEREYVDKDKAAGANGLMWELQEQIPTELQARIKNLETAAIWRNNKLYKKNDLVTKNNLKYICVKDTSYAPMDPHFNMPEYFIQLDERDWATALMDEQYKLEDLNEMSHQYDDIKFNESDVNKTRNWDEIVFYNNKFYKFLGYPDDKNSNKPKIPQQKIPGKLGTFENILEWIPCDSTGKTIPVEDKDYPGKDFNNVTLYMFMRGGPIIHMQDKYFVYNGCYKEIFGLGGPDDKFTSDWYEFWNRFSNKQGPEDTFKTEVFKDGKPAFKHNEAGEITGPNIDVSGLPSSAAAAVTDTVDKNKNKTNCPTGDDDDDDDDDDDSHHEKTQAEKDLEKAMIEWKAKGSIPADNPSLLQGQAPPVGTASGYNIEDLDGNKYHKPKSKRKNKKKNI